MLLRLLLPLPLRGELPLLPLLPLLLPLPLRPGRMPPLREVMLLRLLLRLPLPTRLATP
ncbi:hypothetical protein BN874_870030 [Candidatus Contendobacter odensis Run_B_J11]|uniref:Uncharacterized protein n=1 Tax=Candidatus Contendobacter odensis Run_B_J11 TaxID=1400861 RepID=A0A7U7J6D5_9GAMM|nr:hypothetical protein BN874_870030 [Candidatus Contendobacter odensis Run_B_J11]